MAGRAASGFAGRALLFHALFCCDGTAGAARPGLAGLPSRGMPVIRLRPHANLHGAWQRVQPNSIEVALGPCRSFPWGWRVRACISVCAGRQPSALNIWCAQTMGLGLGMRGRIGLGMCSNQALIRLLEAFAAGSSEALFCLLGRPMHSTLGDRPQLLRAAGSSACQRSCLKSARGARAWLLLFAHAACGAGPCDADCVACALRDMIAHLLFLQSEPVHVALSAHKHTHTHTEHTHTHTKHTQTRTKHTHTHTKASRLIGMQRAIPAGALYHSTHDTYIH